MKLFEKTIVLSSFVAIASRLVGAAYRVADTLNPKFQQSQVISNPRTVFRRETITIGLAFCFAFLSNHFLDPLVKRKGWNRLGVTFFTTVLSTFIAESVARHFAYRATPQPVATSSPPQPQRLFVRPSPLAMPSTGTTGFTIPPIAKRPANLMRFSGASDRTLCL